MQNNAIIKVEAIKQFTLADYDKITNIQRKSVDTEGMLYVGDTFECTKELAEYLTGKNDRGNVVVKIIEVTPEEKKLKEDLKKYMKQVKETSTKPKKKTSKKGE